MIASKWFYAHDNRMNNEWIGDWYVWPLDLLCENDIRLLCHNC